MCQAFSVPSLEEGRGRDLRSESLGIFRILDVMGGAREGERSRFDEVELDLEEDGCRFWREEVGLTEVGVGSSVRAGVENTIG